jgi:hypothetical protein
MTLRNLNLYPKLAGQNKPSFVSGAILFFFQLGMGFLVLIITSLADSMLGVSNSTSMTLLGAIWGAAAYAMWAEYKVPGSLRQRPMVLWLSLYATICQILVSIIYLGLMYWLERLSGEPVLPAPMRFFAYAMPILTVLCFFVCWGGLVLGKRINAQQLVKRNAAKPPSPPENL